MLFIMQLLCKPYEVILPWWNPKWLIYCVVTVAFDYISCVFQSKCSHKHPANKNWSIGASVPKDTNHRSMSVELLPQQNLQNPSAL